MNNDTTLTFEEFAAAAAAAKHDSPGDFSSRDELRTVVNKLTDMYDMGARDGVNHDLDKVKKFLKQEINSSKFSNRMKKQLCGTIETFADINDLTMWLLSEVG
jgi:hypothetical protein